MQWEEQKAEIRDLAVQVNGVTFQDSEGGFKLTYESSKYNGITPVGMGDGRSLSDDTYNTQISHLEELKEEQEERAKRFSEADGPEDVLPDRGDNE